MADIQDNTSQDSKAETSSSQNVSQEAIAKWNKQYESQFVDAANQIIDIIKNHPAANKLKWSDTQKKDESAAPAPVDDEEWYTRAWLVLLLVIGLLLWLKWYFFASALLVVGLLLWLKRHLDLAALVIGLLLLAWIASPVFLHFDADGAVRFTKPWETGQNKTRDGNPTPGGAVTGSGDTSGGGSTQNKPNGKNTTAESTASATMDLATGKCTVNIKNGNTAPDKDKQSSGNVTGASSLKYVNVALAVTAYILGMIFFCAVLRWLGKAERKKRLLGRCGGDFRKLLAGSPDRAEHQKEFMREMIRVYFDKEAD